MPKTPRRTSLRITEERQKLLDDAKELWPYKSQSEILFDALAKMIREEKRIRQD